MTCWHGKKTIINGWCQTFLTTCIAAVSCPHSCFGFFFFFFFFLFVCSNFSVLSVFFFQQARKSLFYDCSMEDYNFSLCEVIEDIVEEMKVKNRGERRK